MPDLEMLKKQVGKIERRVDDLEKDRRELSKLSTLMEVQIRMNKEQDDFLREQSITLVKMNENLTTLNQTTNKLDERIGNLEGRFTENIIDGLENKIKKVSESSIDVPQLLKKVMYTLIISAIIAGVTWVATSM